MNEELKKFINEQKSRNVPNDVIRDALLEKGWKKSVANQLIYEYIDPPSPIHVSDTASRGWSFLNLFEGRINGPQYLGTFLLFCLIGGVVSQSPIVDSLLFIFISIFFSFIISLSITTRRAHDLGMTGWTYLYYLIPFVNFIFFLVLSFRNGDKGSNHYGNPPSKQLFFKMLLNTDYATAKSAHSNADWEIRASRFLKVIVIGLILLGAYYFFINPELKKEQRKFEIQQSILKNEPREVILKTGYSSNPYENLGKQYYQR